ncbi:hypothetical protein FA15DRAFT_675406 [Coprinopsis marcescibilis]|uniref:TPR-like protein n=1 Tax=Coprinopsis marcescibilis TaxID=230819 RepID=A0A5C3KE44_COPMA|nr:hypothetical protein FA15DRAFT_675406 [Coprinopsis marcescibilis]
MNTTLLRQTALRVGRASAVRTNFGLLRAGSVGRLGATRGLADQHDTQSNTRQPKDASQSSTSSPGADPSSSSTSGPDNTFHVEEEVIFTEPVSKSNNVAPWLTGLLVAGLGLLAYGLGELWGAMTIWPKEIRSDLRHGLHENYHGDRAMAEQYLGRAWEKVKTLPISKFGENAYLKTTGIAIALAGIYEADHKLDKAYSTYQAALSQLQRGPPTSLPLASSPPSSSKSHDKPSLDADSHPTYPLREGLSPLERMRAVAISYKLGELAAKMGKPKEEEEKWLVYSVETVLKDVMAHPIAAEVIVQGNPSDQSNANEKGKVVETVGILEDLRLPTWALKHDLAAPFEALGTFYSRTGRIDYAMPLYLQAVSILIPPPPQRSSTDDQCRAAQLMGSISELILRSAASAPSNAPSTSLFDSGSQTPDDSSSFSSVFSSKQEASYNPETLVQAESWARKGLEVAKRARNSTFITHPTCEIAFASMLFNLAVLKEMNGEKDEAKDLFLQSLDQSKNIGLGEGIENSEKAIQRIKGVREVGLA